MKVKFYTRLVITVLFVILAADLTFSNLELAADPVKKFLKREYTFSEARDAIAESYPENLKEKYAFINLNGLFVSSAGQRVCNDVVKLNNGMLYLTGEQADLTPEKNIVVDLYDQLESIGIDFVYVLSPTKMDLNNELLPKGVDCYLNRNSDQLLADLASEGVDFLDLRQDMADTPEHIEEYFYRTDHHWTPLGAFRGFQEISEYLQEMYPEEEILGEYQDLDSWEIHKNEDWFLGSRGKRTGKFFAGTDDLIWLTPKFDTEQSFANVFRNEFYYGDFCDANIRERYIEHKDYFEDNPYCIYVGGNYPLVKYRNLNAPSGKKVLIVQDSFCLPLETFMSTVFKEVDTIDMRYYTCGSLDEYILDTRPDVVLMNFNVGTAQNMSLYGTGADTEIGNSSTEIVSDDGSAVLEPEDDKKYHFETVYSGIRSGKRYRLTLDSVTVTDGETEGLSLRLYDPVSGDSYDCEMFDLNYCEESGGFEWIFTAPEEADNLDLLIYAGVSGHTENIGVEVSGIDLYEYV